MKILIAPDKFKGSLSAREVAVNIAAGLRDVLPDAKIEMVPMADGGEGTAEVIGDALDSHCVNCAAHDPLGREIDTRYAWIEHRKLAIMEMSEAAGMRRLSGDERDPVRANTFGVGEMLIAAARRAADQIIIGLGGSATNDGGFGMARALGFRFFAGDKELAGGRGGVEKVTRIQAPVAAAVPAVMSSLQATRLPLQEKIIAAVDVRNPLLGRNGATQIFGPQKGASEEKIDMLERALTRLADIVARDLKVDCREELGAGAAGGLGFWLMRFCGGGYLPGFGVVAEMGDLDEMI